MGSSEHDVHEYMKTAEGLARVAGDLVRDAYKKDKAVESKSCAVDLVTETDKKVEEMLISSLHKKYPTHKFIGEETTASGEPCQWTDDPTWIIDPVDGTMNFVHSFPFVGICIGLSIAKELVGGIVYNPIYDEMFHAIKGEGAFCNDQPIRVSGQTDFSQSLLITEVGFNNEEMFEVKMFNYKAVVKAGARGIRSLGSAALNMCHVARGSAELYYEYGIHCWDMAAASVIVREAGGVVLDTTGGPLDIMSRRCVAAASEDLIKVFKDHVKHLTLQRD
ncbi:Inositol monophosphatase 1 [Holothuria leucospilota]|uniref:Inositol-1-monophosphatase n=1 Tax=Holothuria leucospilota TaxID=206669 RepID=A0A9Q1CC40_HOLLE|nr:Inositol monophosphatase 1 [Holothuria leucospilota]